jgi:hypothetical protein
VYVAFHKERAKKFGVPGIGVKLGLWVCMMHVVLLQVTPALREMALKSVVPANGFLVSNQGMVLGRVGRELG